MTANRISHDVIGLEGRWQLLENAYQGWQSAAEISRFTGHHEGLSELRDLLGAPEDVTETSYHIYLNRFWPGSVTEQVFGLRVRSAGGFYETRSDTSRYWLTNTAGARYRHTFGHAHQVEAWLRFYQLYDPVNDFDIYLYPDIHYMYQGTGRVSAGLRVRGFVNDPSLNKIHQQNRFAHQYGLDLEHERGLHIRLHSDVQVIRQIKAYTGLDYYQYYNKGYFSSIHSEPSVAQQRPFVMRYVEDATRVEWYHGITHYWRALRTTTNVEIGLKSSAADEAVIPSGEIPYVPDWRGSVHIMSSPLERLDITAWVDINGDRRTDRANEKVDGFTQLGVRTDVRIFNNFGAYIKALNILDQDYEVWQDYQERPFQLYGGLTLHW